MIIVRAPYRVSLLGGMSDYDEYINKFGRGVCIGFAINKYSYITVQRLDKFPARIIYSDIENVFSNPEIEHNSIRKTFHYLDCGDPHEIFHASDLGGNLGLGSSSAFIVALTKALSLLKDKKLDERDLIQTAVKIEQSYSKIGWQDASFSVLGGLKSIIFSNLNDNKVASYFSYSRSMEKLEKCGLLFNTGLSRNSSSQVEKYIYTVKNSKEIQEIEQLATTCLHMMDNLDNETDLGDFCWSVRRSWDLKKKVCPEISNSFIDYLIDGCFDNSCHFARLLGGGGGGCIFAFAEPEYHQRIINFMTENKCKHIPFKIDREGVRQLQ